MPGITPSGYAFLRGMICGLHAGNFDIAHIFIDNLLKIVGDDVDLMRPLLLQWCEVFGAKHGISFTVSLYGGYCAAARRRCRNSAERAARFISS